MNIHSVSPAFKGIYIVKGASKNVDKAEKIVKNQVPLTVFKTDYGRKSTMAIFATEEDSIVLSQELEHRPRLKRLNSSKTLTENFQSILKRVFSSRNDISQTKIITAENIIEAAKDKNKKLFSYIHGHFAMSEHLCLDENYRTYFSNGHVAGVRRPDGSTEEYYSDGTICKQTDADGNQRRYFEDGFLEAEYKTDGSGIEYYGNGSVKSVTNPNGEKVTYYIDGSVKSLRQEDGTVQELYETGKLKKIINPDGSYTAYYSDGKLLEDIDANGIGKTFDKEGNVIAEKCADGRKTEYYPNGRTKAAISPDLTVTTYFENGKIRSIINPDKTISVFNEDGLLAMRKDYNGIMHEYKYDENGLLAKETLSTGEINYFRNGNMVARRKPDGTVYNYAPYKGNKSNYPNLKTIPGYTKLHGYILNIKSPDGSIKYYNENGEVLSEKTADGKFIRYDKK